MKFREGEIYYQCGLTAEGSIVLSTWCFRGYQLTPGRSSSSCDLSEHFYVFEDWFDLQTKEDFPELHVVVERLFIPCLAHANQSMLTLEELLTEIAELRTDIERPEGSEA